MKKLFLLTVIIIGFTVASYAQPNAKANASAKITTAISLAATNDMNFGAIIPGASAGTVQLIASDGSLNPSGVTATTGGGTPAAATFRVTGTGGSNFAITLPSTALTIKSGANTMTVDSWSCDAGATSSIGIGVTTKDIKIGGTLHVGANQPTGTYSNDAGAGFEVTVAYF